ncbi:MULTISPECIES: PGF-CTERM-anchored ABC transporter substrate-binding protein [Halomicrobium]|uniref:Periplasmic binding protein n=2 Tax=Halomicrobium mukohataei TaxID=57705 RepID=C7P0A4_HALMD|nr:MULTISPECIES: PGF-CTERM-anchored ABC transporter substrate-binding protein [Halomicrobium]ACV48896.1 periplasmic binding protein [Halomicrobium mukohataei DSM 12286]QCD64324.1 PGF-CTERM sorting domain-containing protein [Halomicrobium mukohataei]QFR19130.1 ABC transporter substrate-binding protein [Halomicrobium sp. ZPS1]
MRRFSAVVFAAVLVLSAVAVPVTATTSDVQSDGCEFPHSTTDATGTEVTLDSAPDRVVALQPSDAQTMWEIGARDQVAGMPRNANTAYLNDTGNRTDVTNDDGTTDVEAVVGANPDLVLAANATRSDTVDQLRNAGLTVYHFPLATSLDDIANNTETVGRLTGNCEGATETVAEMDERVETVRETVSDRDRPRVLYYFYQYTTGNETHIHDLIETAGGQNVAAEAGLSGYQPINAEVVADSDPQWLVYPSDASQPTGAPYNETTAVQREQVLSVDANYVSQPAPRVVLALEAMAEAFHPDAFETATTSATPATTESATPDTITESETPDTVTESATPDIVTESATVTTDGSGPGFGLVGTVLALVATLALGVRRKGS